MSKQTLLHDVEEMFKVNLKDNKRLSAVFITETGKVTEKILGMITAWDIVGYDE